MLSYITLCSVNDNKFTLYGKANIEMRSKDIADMFIQRNNITGIATLKFTTLTLHSANNFNIYDSNIIEHEWETSISLDDFVKSMEDNEINVIEVKNKREIYKLI